MIFVNATAATESYTLSLHDALPISRDGGGFAMLGKTFKGMTDEMLEWQTAKLLELETRRDGHVVRSEEHTSELQSLTNLVCRLLLEKKKNESLKDNLTDRKQEDDER